MKWRTGSLLPSNKAFQSDRFARKIATFLMASDVPRSRRLNTKPFGCCNQSLVH
jgi:hypothetical protein